MKKIIMLLLSALMILTMLPAELQAKGTGDTEVKKWGVKGNSDYNTWPFTYDPVLSDLVVRNDCGCGRIRNLVPYGDRIEKLTLQIIPVDQTRSSTHLRMAGSLYTYELYYLYPGHMPQGVQIVGQSGGTFYLEIDANAIPGTYSLTAVVYEVNSSRYVKRNWNIELADEIGSVVTNFSQNQVTVPLSGYTKSISAQVMAYDWYGYDFPCTRYDLYRTSGNYTGISVGPAYSTTNGDFTITIGSNASAGTYAFKPSVYKATTGAGASGANATITLLAPILSSISAIGNTVAIPSDDTYKNYTIIEVFGYDQLGDEMPGINYDLSGLPQGVVLDRETNGRFRLIVYNTALPGTYALDAKVYYGQYACSCTVNLTLTGVAPVSGSTVPSLN